MIRFDYSLVLVQFQAYKATNKAHAMPSTSYSSNRTKRVLEDDANDQAEPMNADPMEVQTKNGGTSESTGNAEESKKCKTDENKGT